jgi:hypothetical protein
VPGTAAAWIVAPGAGGAPSSGTVGLIALVVLVPVIAAILIVLCVGWTRALLRRRRASEARLRAAATLEAGARARMSELCPHGWRAQLTLFGADDELGAGAPRSAAARVALDWAEFDDADGHVAIVRRVWAPTIGEALEAMVADRRTDETLERIERSAPAWPD